MNIPICNPHRLIGQDDVLADSNRQTDTEEIQEPELLSSPINIKHAAVVTESVDLIKADDARVDVKMKASTVPVTTCFEGAKATTTSSLGLDQQCLSAPMMSCTSLKTSTTQIPCYFTGNQTPLEIAR